ncbi:MAG: flagellar biosynthesis protein FlgL, partial [Hyphomicrobiales bacterium]
AVETFVLEDVAAASALQASTDFFNISSGNPAQRVDGPPFDSAVALKDATTTDTVSWYTGDLEGNPRDSSLARVDKGYTISYGARADEEALRESVRYLALLSVETFDADVATDEKRYVSLSQKVANGISAQPGEQSVESLQSQLGYKEGTLNSIKERHTQSAEFAQAMLANVELADTNEIGVRLLHLQTLLQASYQTTANLSQLNLANFL